MARNVLGIAVPNYCNLKLYDEQFIVTISLQISEGMIEKLRNNLSETLSIGRDKKGRPILIKSRIYSDVPYSMITCALRCHAKNDLRDMKALLRRVKIEILSDEIDAMYENCL